MAKTISESVSSLETSDLSLNSSLSKCKTSIEKKNVTVPSTTRFSGLPALIDKINSRPIRLDIYSTDAVIEIYGPDSSKIDTLTGKLSYNLTDSKYLNAATAKYRASSVSAEDSLETLLNSTIELLPHTYRVFVDDMSCIDKIIMLDSLVGQVDQFTELEIVKTDNIRNCSVYSTKGKQILIYFVSGKISGANNIKIPVKIQERPSMTILDLNTRTRSWNLLTFTYGTGVYSSDLGTF